MLLALTIYYLAHQGVQALPIASSCEDVVASCSLPERLNKIHYYNELLGHDFFVHMGCCSPEYSWP